MWEFSVKTWLQNKTRIFIYDWNYFALVFDFCFFCRCFNWFLSTPSAIEKTQFDFQLSLRLHWDIFKILQVSRVPFCRSRYLFQVFDSNCIREILYISTTKWVWVDTGYKPRAAGWEARRLPLCYAAPKEKCVTLLNLRKPSDIAKNLRDSTNPSSSMYLQFGASPLNRYST